MAIDLSIFSYIRTKQTEAEVVEARATSHSHTNKETLDKLSFDDEGLKFEGEYVAPQDIDGGTF